MVMDFCLVIVRPNRSKGRTPGPAAQFIGMAGQAFTKGAGTAVVSGLAGHRHPSDHIGTADSLSPHGRYGSLSGRSNMLGHVRKTSNRVAHGLTGVPGAT